MTDRPTGTVTFLFTDIEGSTRLWESRAAWMEKAHARQEAQLRAAFAAHGGYPYKMIGDAFQVAFAAAPDAVAAAIEAQRALAPSRGARPRSASAWRSTPARPRSAATTTWGRCSTAWRGS
ncbi:MAG: hypothetical protein IPK07_18235 [Deltaproteobacteria bacterium]|nr:hypothetical protein [Deltaproteobacteria bacterium]